MIEGTAIVEITYISLNIEDPEFDFVAGSAYSPAQLDNFATIILKQHIRQGASLKGPNPILFAEHIKTRHRREIQTKNGIPDPSIEKGMYWRVHKDGRKVNSDEARKNGGAGFYRS